LISGEFLPDEAVSTLLRILHGCILTDLDIETSLKSYFAPTYLNSFLWDLFLGWYASGARIADERTCFVLGVLGDDAGFIIRMEYALRKIQENEAYHTAFTFVGLRTLASISSYEALMKIKKFINALDIRIDEETRDFGRQQIDITAATSLLQTQDFYDFLMEDIGFDHASRVNLIFDNRRFYGVVDQYLTPWIRDEDSGQLFKELPEAKFTVHLEGRETSVQVWEKFKSSVQANAARVTLWLEGVLSFQYRVNARLFLRFFIHHPLIVNLAKRLVWGIYHDRTRGAAPHTIFHVTDDLLFEDIGGNQIKINDSTASGMLGNVIGLVHPLTLTSEQQSAWNELFIRRKITQPFLQLQRPVFSLTEDEQYRSTLSRFENRILRAGNIEEFLRTSPYLFSQLSAGWKIAKDDKQIWLTHPLPPDRFEGHAVGMSGYFLGVGESIQLSKLGMFKKLQSKQIQDIDDPNGIASSSIGFTEKTFSDLEPVTLSELIRGLTLLVDANAN
jgi:hypothetical protein